MRCYVAIVTDLNHGKSHGIIWDSYSAWFLYNNFHWLHHRFPYINTLYVETLNANVKSSNKRTVYEFPHKSPTRQTKTIHENLIWFPMLFNLTFPQNFCKSRLVKCYLVISMQKRVNIDTDGLCALDLTSYWVSGNNWWLCIMERPIACNSGILPKRSFLPMSNSTANNLS